MVDVETVISRAATLHDVVANSDDAEEQAALDQFAQAAGQCWPDVPMELLLDWLANYGPEVLPGLVTAYRAGHQDVVRIQFVVQVDEDHNPKNPSWGDSVEAGPLQAIADARIERDRLTATRGSGVRLVKRVDYLAE